MCDTIGGTLLLTQWPRLVITCCMKLKILLLFSIPFVLHFKMTFPTVALLVVPQFFTTYVTSHLNSQNAKDDFFENSRLTLKDHIYNAKMSNDTSTLEEWHYIESDLRCCGDIDMTGYTCKVATKTSSNVVPYLTFTSHDFMTTWLKPFCDDMHMLRSESRE